MAGFQNGFIEAAGCMFTYFVVYAQNGFLPSLLINARQEWENASNDNFKDSYGQEWVI